MSGNPSGRPRGAAGLARYIAEVTDGGRELVDRLLEISRMSEKPRLVESATLALLDRLIGRPVQSIAADIHATASVTPQLPGDWDQLPVAERMQWIAALRARAALPAPADDSGDES